MLLPDVNAWLALAFEGHAHHRAAAHWFSRVPSDSTVWCRMTQQGFLRLASNPSVFGPEAVMLDQAWECYDALLADERVGFTAEPLGIEPVWRELTATRAYSPKVWNDAFLAAFARASDATVVSFDRAFTSFDGLRVESLEG